jgi:hypothetical protein
MKSTLYAAGAALLILSSCSTAYKSARTPDDVYYSPKSEKTYASNSNNRQNQGQTSVAAADDQDGTYVTYDDEDQGDYARRLDRFNNPSYSGSYYNDGTPNIYMNNYYGSGFGYGYSPYSYWGGGFGSPYYGSYWGPSLSIGLGFGWGSGFGYGYSPWAYNPWYSPWYTPYYGGYYGGGYGYGHYPGAYGYAAPSRGYRTRNGFGGSSYNNGNRVIGNNGSTSGDYRPRRIFSNPSNNGGFNNGGRTSGNNGSGYQPRRIFRSSPSETPTMNPGNNGGGGRRIFSAPERSSSPAPQRTFSAPSRTFSAPSAPSGGGGGGGGGRTFRTRN